MLRLKSRPLLPYRIGQGSDTAFLETFEGVFCNYGPRVSWREVAWALESLLGGGLGSSPVRFVAVMASSATWKIRGPCFQRIRDPSGWKISLCNTALARVRCVARSCAMLHLWETDSASSLSFTEGTRWHPSSPKLLPSPLLAA